MARPFEPVQVPPLAEQKGEAYVRLVEIMQRLLAPDGCPWDREQSPLTLRRYVLEEACEVIDAIEDGDKGRIAGELGDVLFALVNLARHVDVDAEGALRGTIAKFQRRFEHVEARVKERHGGWPAASTEGAGKLALEELDAYWD